MKSSFQSSSKRLFFLKFLTPLLFTAGLIGLGTLSHCTKTDNPVDPGSGGDACANACTASQVCSKGTCKTACDIGLTTCGSSCVDVTQDAAHCGACGNVCTANQVCTASSCTLQIPAAAIQTIAVNQIRGAVYNLTTVQDSQGNVYLTGYFQGTVTLGNKTITAGGLDAFVAKMGLNGQVIWATSFNQTAGTIISSGKAIAVDAQGNVYVGGDFAGRVTFSASIELISEKDGSNYTRDAFLTKLDPDGKVVWAFKYGEGAGGYYDTIEAVTVDQQGSVIALAQYRDSLGWLGSSQISLAIMKYSAATTQKNSTPTWIQKWGMTTTDSFSRPQLVTDAEGNILVLHTLRGSIDTRSSNPKFTKIETAKDPNSGAFTDSNKLVKLTQNTGAILWVSSPPYDSGQINLFTSQGSLVVMGDFSKELDFGADNTGNALKIPALPEGSSIYWSNWDLTTGKPIAARALEGSGNRTLLRAKADSQGNIWVLSSFRDKASYGQSLLQPAHDVNMALVKLEKAGKTLWAERVNDGAVLLNNGYYYSVNNFENVVLDAQNSPWVFFGISTQTSNRQPTSIGGTKLTPKGNLLDFGFAKFKP